MKLLRSQDGIALVTSLMLTLISMTIIMALMYMLTQGTKVSGQFKRYKSALDASYGGTEIYTKDIFPFVMRNYSSGSLVADLQGSSVGFAGVGLVVNTTQSCLQAKLTKNTENWPSGCDKSPQPAKNPDMSLTLQAASGNPFTVFSKIVDTTTGNSDVSGLQLEGKGVSEASTVLTPQHFPYIYRIEVQGQQTNNATAQSNIEVLYAY
jgi:Flp pilus assembly pilin Flp